ncbi:MAG: DUF559 domain-containing protein [Planctomycetaceae bacterium]
MSPKEPNPNTEKARDLRRRMPSPERYLWSLLRSRKLAGLKFRRQVPIGPFVVDFYCESARLVVELDGMSHDGRGDYDKRRQRYLEEAKLTVFRVQNEELLQDTEAVLLGIAKAAHIDLRSYYGNLFGPTQAANERTRPPLTPLPRERGTGNEAARTPRHPTQNQRHRNESPFTARSLPDTPPHTPPLSSGERGRG